MEDKKQSAMVRSEYVGTLKDASEKPAKKKKLGPKEWMRFMYPNRSVRRKYAEKSNEKYAMSKSDIESGKTFLEKVGEIIRGNQEHGAMLHRSFENEVATDHMHYERSKDESCRKHLIEALGEEAGEKAYRNNRRISGIYEEKKMMR